MGYPPRDAPAGQFLHVRTRATASERLHRDYWDYEGMLYRLGLQVVEHELHCVSFCLMPTHVHAVLRPARATVSDAMRNLLNGYAQRYNRRWERRGHLVERRFRCKPARSTAHLYEMLRYVHLNPVKDGLVARPEQWLHSSYAATIGLVEPPPWLDVETALRLFHRDPATARSEYRAFVEGRLV
jgi:REP element-mobilizing transposase RayT